MSNLVVNSVDGVLTIRLNEPRRKNPITVELFRNIPAKLNEVANDPNCRVVVITGTGDYFSSGNDLKNSERLMAEVSSESNFRKAVAELGVDMIDNFQKSFITFPKPLIALVNGPAIGIMVTILPLCDAVLASDRATFSAPFSRLGQSLEGCSSLTFPLAMGPLIASDVLLFGRVLNAEEALRFGLISRLVPHDSFEHVSNEFIKEVNALPAESLRVSKQLLRGKSGQLLNKSVLAAVSKEECEILAEIVQSDDYMNAMAKFFNRKTSKL